MSDVALAVATTEALSALERSDATEPSERFLVAAKATRNHWMATDENTQFLAACEALYGVSDEADKERIRGELEALRDLNAMLSGVPVDFEAMAERAAARPEPIGLRGLWQQSAVSS